MEDTNRNFLNHLLPGIAVFGIMGFIIGPVIAIFFMTLLDIYSIEFKSTLDLAKGGEMSEGVEEKVQPAENR